MVTSLALDPRHSRPAATSRIITPLPGWRTDREELVAHYGPDPLPCRHVFCGVGWEIIDKTHLIHFTSPMNSPFNCWPLKMVGRVYVFLGGW